MSHHSLASHGVSPRGLLASLGAVLVVLAPVAVSRADEGAGVEFFEKKIRPVLVEHCYRCHSSEAKALKGKLRLDSRAGLLQGGDNGPAVVPGDVEESLLIGALRYDLMEMPPAGKLPDEVVADFERWVEMGAPDPRNEPAGTAPAKPATIDFDEARQFWSFRPPARQQPPEVADPGWVRRPIDTFLLARIEAAGLSPSPEADRRTLIRRVTFDLSGLPPTPEEVEAFVADNAPDAYERLVDRLLAAPRYGERWARMWLDVARYAEDQAHIVGKDTSLTYPNAYLYRDWVIGALNEDMPYDEFLRLQLAADLIEPTSTTDLAALGFLGLGPKYYRRNAPEVMADEWEDRVDVVSRGLLGLTVACARCHDHKYDPIPTADYYALAGVFASTEMFNRPMKPESDEPRAKDEDKDKDKDKSKTAPEDAIHIVRDGTPTDLNILIRGDVHQKGPVVVRHFLTVLGPDGPAPLATDGGSGRRALAEAIAGRDNPLTARVLVNRIWALDFGRPLVATASNFGRLGEPPTHPELLDDLAARFMEAGWSLKWLQREIVLSSAYRQASHIDPSKQAADPENRLLWRMNRRRLDVESWRDAILAAAGRLDPRVGGHSIDPKDPEERHRTVYSRISRLELNPLLALFDFPDPNAHSERRVLTITPLQKLFVLNSPFMVRQADALVDRLAAEAEAVACSEAGAGPDDGGDWQIGRASPLLFGRPPTESEVRLGRAYLGSSPDERRDRWPGYAQALLASNEMMVID